jgi:hypothetical protein
MLSDHLSPPSRQPPYRCIAWGHPPVELSRSYAIAPLRVTITHVYKKGMNEKEVQSINFVSRILLITRYRVLLYEPLMGEQREIEDQELSKMLT